MVAKIHNCFSQSIPLTSFHLTAAVRPQAKKKKSTQQLSKNIYIIKSDGVRKKASYSMVIVCDGMKRGFEIIHKVFKVFFVM